MAASPRRSSRGPTSEEDDPKDCDLGGARTFCDFVDNLLEKYDFHPDVETYLVYLNRFRAELAPTEFFPKGEYSCKWDDGPCHNCKVAYLAQRGIFYKEPGIFDKWCEVIQGVHNQMDYRVNTLGHELTPKQIAIIEFKTVSKNLRSLIKRIASNST